MANCTFCFEYTHFVHGIAQLCPYSPSLGECTGSSEVPWHTTTASTSSADDKPASFDETALVVCVVVFCAVILLVLLR